MSAQRSPQSEALVAGGHERHGAPPATELPARGTRQPGRRPAASIVAQESAAEGPAGCASTHVRTAAGSWAGIPWAPWALPQIRAALAVAARTPAGTGVAAHLYRDWFNPELPQLELLPAFRYAMPLAGVYRAAHAGSARQRSRDGVGVIDRRDVVGHDGWWRTWGSAWAPPRQRRAGVRLVLSPRPDRLAVAVRTVTAALSDSRLPWSLACATSPRRLRRTGGMVVDLPAEAAVPPGLIAALEPVLVPQLPPLCLPLGRGAALAGHPGDGMTFGEHRCHLIALALRSATYDGDAVAAVAGVFAAHGIDPAAPHRGPSRQPAQSRAAPSVRAGLQVDRQRDVGVDDHRRQRPVQRGPTLV